MQQNNDIEIDFIDAKPHPFCKIFGYLSMTTIFMSAVIYFMLETEWFIKLFFAGFVVLAATLAFCDNCSLTKKVTLSSNDIRKK